jgi:hypothetical protein
MTRLKGLNGVVEVDEEEKEEEETDQLECEMQFILIAGRKYRNFTIREIINFIT